MGRRLPGMEGVTCGRFQVTTKTGYRTRPALRPRRLFPNGGRSAA